MNNSVAMPNGIGTKNDTDLQLPLYADEMFITVSEDSGDEIIEQFCNEVFHHILCADGTRDVDELRDKLAIIKSALEELSDSGETYPDDSIQHIDELCNKALDYIASKTSPKGYIDIVFGLSDLKMILKNFPRPFTIVQEFYHIDKWYRDSYYTYFSNQHFSVKRHSRRLSFFEGAIDEGRFFSDNKKISTEIEKGFIGMCVLNPLISGIIGRTLINPKYVINGRERPAYIRLSEYTVHIYGKIFSVQAFPYRMQDGETTRCAEVTLINLLDYFSNRYDDYKQIVPSEILEVEQRHNHERVLPSQGMTYPMLTKALSEFGFSPRLYNLSSIYTPGSSGITKEDIFKRLLYYYVESGIPVAIGLFPSDNNSGHSIVCIGHGEEKESCRKKAMQKKWVSWDRRNKCHPLIDAADFYDDFIVVDDNQPIYQKRAFNRLSLHSAMRAENMTVPLYKRMFMDAMDASAIIRSILQDEKYGIDAWGIDSMRSDFSDKGYDIDAWVDDFLGEREDVVTRIFMASSRNLKGFRTKTLKSIYAKKALALTPMPRFVWVCELYKVGDYSKREAFGEIIIDATSASTNRTNNRSLILMHYPHVIAYRMPDQEDMELTQMVILDDDEKFQGFDNNLTRLD